MKKIVLFIAMGLSTLSFASSPSQSLFDEIQNKVRIDLSSIELNQYEQDYVVVNFTIFDGKVNITKIDGTQSVLKELVKQELQEMIIQSDYSTNAVYRYKFTFEKV